LLGENDGGGEYSIPIKDGTAIRRGWYRRDLSRGYLAGDSCD
jgi:hypothetical protein